MTGRSLFESHSECPAADRLPSADRGETAGTGPILITGENPRPERPEHRATPPPVRATASYNGRSCSSDPSPLRKTTRYKGRVEITSVP